MAQQKDDTILEAQRSKLKPPPMFKVMLLNDDYTPMEFVVVVLQKFFGMSRERATPGDAEGASRRHRSLWGLSPRRCYHLRCSKSRHTPGSTSIPLQCVMEET
jgi:ATP-dependent Clp protease adaptor protein ClpS